MVVWGGGELEGRGGIEKTLEKKEEKKEGKEYSFPSIDTLEKSDGEGTAYSVVTVACLVG